MQRLLPPEVSPNLIDEDVLGAEVVDSPVAAPLPKENPPLVGGLPAAFSTVSEVVAEEENENGAPAGFDDSLLAFWDAAGSAVVDPPPKEKLGVSVGAALALVDPNEKPPGVPPLTGAGRCRVPKELQHHQRNQSLE